MSSARVSPAGPVMRAWARRTPVGWLVSNSASTLLRQSGWTISLRCLPRADSGGWLVMACHRALTNRIVPCVSVRKISSCTLLISTDSSCSRRAVSCWASSRSRWAVSRARALRHDRWVMNPIRAKANAMNSSGPRIDAHHCCTVASYGCSTKATKGRVWEVCQAPRLRDWKVGRGP